MGRPFDSSGKVWIPIASDVGCTGRAATSFRQLFDNEHQRPEKGTEAAVGCGLPWLAVKCRWPEWVDFGGQAGSVRVKQV